jgi:hypothetical protein
LGDPIVGLNAVNSLVAVTPESYRKVTTGRFDVVLSVVSFLCEVPPVVPLLA